MKPLFLFLKDYFIKYITQMQPNSSFLLIFLQIPICLTLEESV